MVGGKYSEEFCSSKAIDPLGKLVMESTISSPMKLPSSHSVSACRSNRTWSSRWLADMAGRQSCRMMSPWFLMMSPWFLMTS
eukprot:4392387-Prorocentrum_lima.AAC.1